MKIYNTGYSVTHITSQLTWQPKPRRQIKSQSRVVGFFEIFVFSFVRDIESIFQETKARVYSSVHYRPRPGSWSKADWVGVANPLKAQQITS